MKAFFLIYKTICSENAIMESFCVRLRNIPGYHELSENTELVDKPAMSTIK
jgi:hypothetical protein